MRAPLAAAVVVGAAGLACGSSSGGGSGGPRDAASDASAVPGDAGATCMPAPLGSWAPTHHGAQPAQASACTAAMIADFYASCLAPSANGSACDQSWGSGEDLAHATCQNCLVTPSSNLTWGPVVNYGSSVSVNVAGCIELRDPGSAACATSVQQADECEHQACDAPCPALADFESCVAAVDQGACATYSQGAMCEASEADGGPAQACVAGATFEDLFTVAASVFCAGG